MITREIGHFFVGMMFLTRLPAPPDLNHAEGRLARAARYFTLIGVLIGLIGGGVFFFASHALSAPIAGGLAILTTIILTGALHEDGLADTADGLGGGSSREQALEIMRDSRLGTYGVCAVVFSIGLRVAALATLAPLEGMIAMIVAHAVSRGMLPPVLVSGANARTRGLASSVAGGVSHAEAGFAFLAALAVAMIAGPVVGMISFTAAVIASGLLLVQLVRRLGGYTGDGLGAIQQASEIAVLVVISGLWA